MSNVPKRAFDEVKTDSIEGDFDPQSVYLNRQWATNSLCLIAAAPWDEIAAFYAILSRLKHPSHTTFIDPLFATFGPLVAAFEYHKIFKAYEF